MCGLCTIFDAHDFFIAFYTGGVDDDLIGMQNTLQHIVNSRKIVWEEIFIGLIIAIYDELIPYFICVYRMW